MRHLCSSLHCVSLESWCWDALQVDRRLSNLREDQECVSNMSLGSRIRAASSSARYCAWAKERGAKQRGQQGILCAKHGWQGASRLDVVAYDMAKLCDSWRQTNPFSTLLAHHQPLKICSNLWLARTHTTNAIVHICAPSLSKGSATAGLTVPIGTFLVYSS